MYDLHDYRCPSCKSADVARVQTKAIYDELVECHSCKGIYQVEYVVGTAQPGLIKGPREPKRSHRSRL